MPLRRNSALDNALSSYAVEGCVYDALPCETARQDSGDEDSGMDHAKDQCDGEDNKESYATGGGG